MAYLRWISSNWYSYRHIDGGEGAAAVFMAQHGQGPGVTVCLTAGAMSAARGTCPSKWMRNVIDSLPGGADIGQEDVDELQAAADVFLHEVFMAGLVPMPPSLARRYRVLRRLVRRRVNRLSGRWSAQPAEPVTPAGEWGALDIQRLAQIRRQHPEWAWIEELRQIDRLYPPPPLPVNVKELMRQRSLCALTGQEVSAEQDEQERRLISAAHDAWPPTNLGRK